jgi:hypothetical protein
MNLKIKLAIMSKSIVAYFLISLGFIFTGYAQQGIGYQGGIFEMSGQPLSLTSVDLRISVYDDLIGTIIFYQEDHTVSTLNNGAFSLIIGTGLYVSGTELVIEDIPWKSGNKFLNVSYRETAVGGSYFDLGTSQLLAVPFAYHSQTTSQKYKIPDLIDVDTSLIETGHTLIWNGTNWEVGNVDTVLYSVNSGHSIYADTANVVNMFNISFSDTTNYSYLADSSHYSSSAGYSDSTGFSVYSDTSNYADSVLNSWGLSGNAVGAGSFIGTLDSVDFRLFTDSIERMVVTADGKIGIGITTPLMDFEIDGQNGLSLVSDIGIGNSYTFKGDRFIWYPRKAHMYSGGGSTVLTDATIGNYSVGLGYNVQPTGDYSFAMGRSSKAFGDFSFAGGDASFAYGDYSFSFGYASSVQGMYAVGMGRGANSDGTGSIALGYHPFATGAYSMACGYHAYATDTSSFALGYKAHSDHKGTFVYSDQSSTNAFYSTAANQFMVRVRNGATFYSAADLSAGVELMPGGGAWSSLSDSTKKKHIRPIIEADILNKLNELEVYEWNYKTQHDSIVHIGPMAQDFMKAFGYGESELMINTVDIDGVNMAVLKALSNKAKKLESKLEDYENLLEKYLILENEKREMERLLEKLEQLISEKD